MSRLSGYALLLEDAEEPVHEEGRQRRAHKRRDARDGETVPPVVVGLVLDGNKGIFIICPNENCRP